MSRAIVLAVVVLAFAAFAPAAHAQNAGIGYFPSELLVKDGLRGQRYPTGTVIVNQTAEQQQFKLSGTGTVGPWLNFAEEKSPETLTTDVVAEPNSQLRLIVYVNIPPSVGNGDYTGEVLMENYPLPGQTRDVVPAFRQGIKVTVGGTQKLALQVGSPVVNDVEAGQLLRIQTQVGNASNVAVAPTVSVSVQAVVEGTVAQTVGKVSGQGDQIPPGGDAAVVSSWDTQGQETGAYRATVTVSAQGQDFGVRYVDFKLVPPGSLSRSAKISSMQVVGVPKRGTIARVDVTFANQGQVEVQGKFVGQVYLDNSVVAETESKVDATAHAHEQATVSTFFPIDKDGEYTLRGKVAFEGGQTEEMSLNFRVGSGGGSSSLWLPAGLGVVALTISGGAAGFWVRRRRVSH